uniref:ORF59c n=1 Tax=Pinus koraiensis TaxID=88728 RepID=A4QMG5_PINKO|nr:ORF59c [Pinus koraiensis]
MVIDPNSSGQDTSFSEYNPLLHKRIGNSLCRCGITSIRILIELSNRFGAIRAGSTLWGI